jgi:hypothetical protein
MSRFGAYRAPSQLKESSYETSDYPSIGSRRLRCLGDNGSERDGLRSRCIPGRLCRGAGCCSRSTSRCQTWCCRRSAGPCSSQGVLIFLQIAAASRSRRCGIPFDNVAEETVRRGSSKRRPALTKANRARWRLILILKGRADSAAQECKFCFLAGGFIPNSFVAALRLSRSTCQGSDSETGFQPRYREPTSHPRPNRRYPGTASTTTMRMFSDGRMSEASRCWCVCPLVSVHILRIFGDPPKNRRLYVRDVFHRLCQNPVIL